MTTFFDYLLYGVVIFMLSFTVVCLFMIQEGYAELPDFIWAPHSYYDFETMEIIYDYRKIPIIYGVEEPCNTPQMLGCYMSSENPYIEFSYRDIFVIPECSISIWDHETIHAWGVTHAEMQLWFNPCIEFHETQKFPKFPNMREGFYIQ